VTRGTAHTELRDHCQSLQNKRGPVRLRNVVGHSGATSTWSRSSTPTLTRWLLSGLHLGKGPKVPHWGNMREEEDEVFRAMAFAQYYLRPPTQKVEFVAKTIAIGEVSGMKPFIGVNGARAILATPLYVAQNDVAEVVRFHENPFWGLSEVDWIVGDHKEPRKLMASSDEKRGRVLRPSARKKNLRNT
jgi:hypothetical protein